jgi:ubiquinone/menaquinone biosynthesis C-methylase UbiE
MTMATDQMRLGRTEFAMMNNPVRRFLQKHVEFRVFRQHLCKHGIDLANKAILDAGCGSGYSTELIASEFLPSRLVAFDLMPEQIALAKRRGLNADIFVVDMTHVELPDETFDATFIFGVLHHIPGWRIALREMARVLRLNGVLLVEEPQVRFGWPRFEQGMGDAGLEILEKSQILTPGFQSYLAKKTEYVG